MSEGREELVFEIIDDRDSAFAGQKLWEGFERALLHARWETEKSIRIDAPTWEAMITRVTEPRESREDLPEGLSKLIGIVVTVSGKTPETDVRAIVKELDTACSAVGSFGDIITVKAADKSEL